MLKGKRYGVLFFYSSTCDHCHLQMPGIARVHALYGPKGVQVLAVALDDDRKDFRFNLEIREVKYPCYSEFNGWGSNVAKAYEVKATPTIVLIDAERRIVAKPYDSTELEAELARALGQP
jgi:thiol-disulfide isomerase/thioredoxin